MVEPYRRYLRILGIEGVPRGIEGLRGVVRRHVCRVPFENVSKLLLFRRERAGRPIRLEEFLDGIEYQDFGGTCYSSNPFLADLLRAAGYEAALFGADMSEPNVHTSIRVRLDGREYHVDAGYAAPFFEPLPLDALPIAVTSGGHRYVLDRTAAPGSCRLTMFVDGEPRHGYVVHPPERAAAFFAPAIVRSYDRDRTFMRVLRITRFFDDHAIEIRNTRLLRHSAGRTIERVLTGLPDLRRAVTSEFAMPRCQVEDAVAMLEELSGREFFGALPWADAV